MGTRVDGALAVGGDHDELRLGGFPAVFGLLEELDEVDAPLEAQRQALEQRRGLPLAGEEHRLRGTVPLLYLFSYSFFLVFFSFLPFVFLLNLFLILNCLYCVFLLILYCYPSNTHTVSAFEGF